MTLHAVAQPGKPGLPWLVFLHGFSGDAREWQRVGERLNDYPRLYIDLPGHGKSVGVEVSDFTQVRQALRDTLNSYNILNHWLIGYSLGGRIAISWACEDAEPGLCGIIVEGGHPGLTDEAARQVRWASDSHWAMCFRQQPLTQVFDAWYRQPVFANLMPDARRALVSLRQENSGPRLAKMLLATSLAVQPDYRPALRTLRVPFHYLCGENDAKFAAVADELAATHHIIHDAGHNAHRENPAQVADRLAHILRF